MRKLWKRSLSLALVGGLLITLGLSANAYYLFGGKLIDGIYMRRFYIQSGIPCYDSATQAFKDWNWVLNPKENGEGVDFFFYQVSGPSINESYGEISILYEEDSDDDFMAITDFYYAHKNIGDPVTNYEYVRITVNGFYRPVGDYYQEMRKIINHEIGHAVGLMHNDYDNGTIMYPEYWKCTAYSPTLDDITGVRALYG